MNRTLVAFAREFLSKPFSAIRPPKSSLYRYVTTGGAVQSMVLCRRPPFQVELFTVLDRGHFPEHSHPNVDSIEILLSGEIAFTRDGEPVFPTGLLKGVAEDGAALSCGRRIQIPAHQAHGGQVGPGGGAFLSIQQWLNGVEPTSVGLDWLGPEHVDVMQSGDGTQEI